MSEENTEERGFGTVEEREVPEDGTDNTEGEQSEATPEEGKDNKSEQADNQQSEEGNEDQNQGDGTQDSKQDKTEKGTKLDPNPQSAVHQQLANERRTRGQMEKVLADPALLAQFVEKQYGIKMPVSGAQSEGQGDQGQSAVTTKKWTAKDFESLDDVADKFNGLQDSFSQEIANRDKEIKTLKDQIGGIQDNGRLRSIAESAESDVSSLKSIPELTPNNPDFIEGLEGQIASLYHRLDFDEDTQQYRGQYSIKEIGKSLIETARAAKKAGVKRGQTIVRDKTGGQIRTSPGSKDAPDRETMTAGASIAAGIADMFKK